MQIISSGKGRWADIGIPSLEIRKPSLKYDKGLAKNKGEAQILGLLAIYPDFCLWKSLNGLITVVACPCLLRRWEHEVTETSRRLPGRGKERDITGRANMCKSRRLTSAWWDFQFLLEMEKSGKVVTRHLPKKYVLKGQTNSTSKTFLETIRELRWQYNQLT